MANIIVTKNERETKRVAAMFARSIIKELIFGKKAVVVVLSGDLGAGKTTFAQGFAKGLSVKKPVKSPTFVILKRYHLQNVRCQMSDVRCFRYFYHIDCYRFKNARDARALGLAEILKSPANLVLIEWPERIKNILSKKQTITVKFSHINETSRKISFN